MKILYNANIYTQDRSKPKASSLIIHNGRIQAVGTDQEMMAENRPGWQTENMQGRTIWPGLVDAHAHLAHYSLSLHHVACETSTRAECLQNVADRAKKTPQGAWILGWGFNQNVWAEGYGNAALLDSVAPNHPVMLIAKSGHAAWVNTLALHKSGVTVSTPDPLGGVIQRDPSGTPTGMLFEEASDLVKNVVPATTVAEYVEALLIAQSNLWQFGLTGVHDFDTPEVFQALQMLNQSGKLRLRVNKGIPGDQLEHAAAAGLRSGFGSDYLRIGSLKLFADGALGPQTAAMLEPFEESDKNKGILLMTSDQLFEIGQKAAQHGISLATHAIGDLANREILDGYEKLRRYERQHHLPALRHRIEHVQLLHADDLNRLAKLDIIASMQPIHCTSDMLISDRFWGKRAAGAYAFKTLLDLGTHLAFGSDAPVEIPNPFIGLHAAVTRCRADGTPGTQGWHPEQKITLQQALDAYTLAPAYAAGIENRLGRLAPGFFADLIVLEKDPFELPPQSLHTIQPTATMSGGDWVWQHA
jgi:predicted amidohydrolase YtcJ